MPQLQIYANADLQMKAIYVKFILNDVDAIKKIRTVNSKLRTFSDADGKGVQLVVPLKDINAFKEGKILPALIGKANELGYSSPDLNIVKSDIDVASKSFATPKAKAEAVKKTNDVLDDFFSKYNEPQVQELMHKLMAKIKVSVGDEKKYAANILSLHNRVMAYAQKPDATFIASARIWRQYYNRRVLPTAKPIIIMAGDNGNFFNSKLASDELGVDYNQSRQNRHTALAFDRTAKYGDSDPSNFFGVVYFDVSDTEPYGDTDRFNDDEGLKSNLSGELNAKALDKRANSLGDDDADIGKLQNRSNSEMIFNRIVEYCKDKPEFNSVRIAAANKNGSDISATADIVEALFRVLFEREHDSNKLEEKVMKCTCVILSLYDSVTPKMISYMTSNNDKFNSQDLRKMYAQVSNVKYIIENEMNESVGQDLTFKEFLDMLHIDINALKQQDANMNQGMNVNDNQNNMANEEVKRKVNESFRRLWNKMI